MMMMLTGSLQGPRRKQVWQPQPRELAALSEPMLRQNWQLTGLTTLSEPIPHQNWQRTELVASSEPYWNMYLSFKRYRREYAPP